MTLLTVMSQNIQYGAYAQGRLPGLYEAVREARPDVLLLQEVLDLQDPRVMAEAAVALGMEIELAPTRRLPTAVAWRPEALTLIDVETTYSTTDLHHGYCAPRFEINGLTDPLPVPLVVICTHLTPYSAGAAACEAQLLLARVFRHGGIGLIGGDINHPTFDDPEPDWTRVAAYAVSDLSR